MASTEHTVVALGPQVWALRRWTVGCARPLWVECDHAVLACTPRRQMTLIILLNTRVPTRLALLAHLAALGRRSTLALLRFAEGIHSW